MNHDETYAAILLLIGIVILGFFFCTLEPIKDNGCLEGRVIDKQADIGTGSYFLVTDSGSEIISFEVREDEYYSLDIGSLITYCKKVPLLYIFDEVAVEIENIENP